MNAKQAMKLEALTKRVEELEARVTELEMLLTQPAQPQKKSGVRKAG